MSELSGRSAPSDLADAVVLDRGEMSFITGEPPTADVVAIDPIRYVAWPKAELRSFLAEHPSLRAAWQAVLGADLVGKLRAA